MAQRNEPSIFAEQPFSSLLVDPAGDPIRLRGPEPAEPDHELPSAERVARRALVTVVLAWRAAAERQRPKGAEAQLAVASAWAEARGLVEEMEEDEVRLLRQPAWTWLSQEIVDRSWGSEAAAVLAWCLLGPELPAPDQQADPGVVGRALGLFTAQPAVLEKAALRSLEELAWMRNRLLGVNWRLREFASVKKPMDFVAFVKERWAGRLDFEGIPLVDGDLAVGGVALASADPQKLQIAMSIATERHRAIEWVCGADPRWSAVRL